MHTRPRLVAAIPMLLALAACVAPYDKFYTKVITPEFEAYLLPWSGRTDYVSTSTEGIPDATRRLGEKGYQLLGYVAFEANAGDYTSSLKAKAAEVQADVVLVSSEFAGTLNTVVPILNYTPGQNSTTFTSGTVNATARNNYGATAYGTANYSGTSTTTSPGTFNTNYIPVQVQRSKNEASFWRKRTFVFGAAYVPLTPEIRQQLERNSGLVIIGVVENSAAFLANILIDDILVSIDDEPIISVEEFNQQIRRKAGQKIAIEIIRKGKTKTIVMQLSPLRVATTAR